MLRRFRRAAGHPRTAFTLLLLGAFCLAMAPLVPWYVLPRLEQSPADINTTSTQIASGSVFDGTGLKGPSTFTITVRLVGQVDAGQPDGVAVWDLSTQVDTPDTVDFHDPRMAMNWMVERYVFDRHTNVPVHCCGESPAHEGDAYLKFPFHVTKGTYQYWNPFIKKAYPVTYAGDVTLEGHTLYKFVGRVPPTKIGTLDVPGAIAGLKDQPGMVHLETYYRDDGGEMLIDPASGSPISVTQKSTTTARLPGGTTDLLTLSTLTVAPSPETVHATLAQAVEGDRLLEMAGTDVPVTLLVTGIILVVLGVMLTVRGARRSRAVRVERPDPVAARS